MELGQDVYILGKIAGLYQDGTTMVQLPDGQGVLTNQANLIPQPETPKPKPAKQKE